MPSTILVVLGTRPEAIKLAPVIVRMKETQITPLVICTGQHTDMVTSVFDFFRIKLDRWLTFKRLTSNTAEVGTTTKDKKQQQWEKGKDGHSTMLSPSLIYSTGQLMIQLTHLIIEHEPNMIVVQGDTISAYAGAMAGFLSKIPVAHVEAGLRSFNLSHPWPEEGLRRCITTYSTLHFSPTKKNWFNLIRENISSKHCHIVGNPIVDALNHIKSSLPDTEIRDEVVITSHRRENWGKPIMNICRAVVELASRYTDTKFNYYVHPNPLVSTLVKKEIAKYGLPNIVIHPSTPYDRFIKKILVSRLIITDSGGIQEEAVAIGIPTLVTRHVTERQEGLSSILKLVGTETNSIITSATPHLEKITRRKPSDVYGKGDSSALIVNRIKRFLRMGP